MRTLLVPVILLGAVWLVIRTSPTANYIWKAYFFPGSSANLRGYPIVEPPSDFSGTWVHYAYTGRPLALLNVVGGQEEGRQLYLQDNSAPYLIRYIKNGMWEHDELSLGPPAPAVVPWFLPQRWVNRSLDRLALLDKLFPEPPAVSIIEEGNGELEKCDAQPIIPPDRAHKTAQGR